MDRPARHSIHAQLIRNSKRHRPVRQKRDAIGLGSILLKVTSAVSLMRVANRLRELGSQQLIKGSGAGHVELLARERVHVGELPVEEA